MLINDFIVKADEWTAWANDSKCYDVALFKTWIQFERFLSEIFVSYAIGEPSEQGYSPNRVLRFKDQEHLNVFMRENSAHIDYPAKIRKYSKHIFEKDPFDTVIFSDSKYSYVYSQIFDIRNYIAHESNDAKLKYIKSCFGNKPERFKSPNDYLLIKHPEGRITNYTYYIEALKEIVTLLIDPPRD